MRKLMALSLGVFLFVGALIVSDTFSVVHPGHSVVEVLSVDGSGHGTGFYIGDGRIITAAHVARMAGDDKKFRITYVDPKTHKDVVLFGTVKWMDSDTDTAEITIDKAPGLEAANLACELPDVSVGTRVTSIGYPLELGLVETWGRIAERNLIGSDGTKYTVANLTVAPGNSGGPVFDEKGRVVGLTDAISAMPQLGQPIFFPTLSLLIPRSSICAVVEAHDKPQLVS